MIPAHREAASIGAVVAEASRFASVIVVDDCSPDATAEIARASGASVVSSGVPLGYEAALNRGFAEAAELGFTHVVTMDADGEHDPALVRCFRDLLFSGRVQLVLGVRPRKQRIAEILMGLYVRLRFGARDILCGMKGYDLQLYRANRGFSHSDSIGTELAINSLRRGVRFVEVSVSGRRRVDPPRFDRKLRANRRIIGALQRILRDDLAARASGSPR